MDKMIGRLVATLEENHLRQNTLLIFLGDNGTGTGTPSQMGDRTVVGGKGSTTAAGMHVPCIVHWPADLPRRDVAGKAGDPAEKKSRKHSKKQASPQE